MLQNFSGQPLQSRSFKGQDLTEANFSYANIRGVDFTNATLVGANFTGAIAGVPDRRTVGLLIASLILSALSGYASGIVSTYAAYWLLPPKTLDPNTLSIGTPNTTFISGIGLILFAIFSIVSVGQSLKTTSGAMAWVVAVGVAGPLAGALALAVVGHRVRALALAVTWVGGLVVAVGLALAIALALARALSWAEERVFTLARSWVLALAVALAFAIARSWALVSAISEARVITAGTFAGAVTVALPAGYIGWRALVGDEKFSLIKKIAISLSATKGTSFRRANLTDANFTQAILKGTDLSAAILTRTRFYQAKKLEQAKVDGTILMDSNVRDLVTTCQGNNKSYAGCHLREANLVDAELSDADLTAADVSGATFQGACLERANLTRVQALAANFNTAKLTGACLEAWHIDNTTELDGAICDYVYLLNNQRERRPSSGEFASGEFAKLFQEVLNTVDLIFRNGIDWKAFVYSFKKLQVENEDTELSIQGIENKGDGVIVVKVSVPSGTDKAKIHSEFNQNYDLALNAIEAKYQAELKAKDEQIVIYRQQSADMKEIVSMLATKPVNVEVNATAESKTMNESTDQSRNIRIGDVGRDFNASAGALSQGNVDISGTVTNTINQLPDSPQPEQPGIKELLAQLQAAIEAESDLSEEDKAEALVQVKALAEAGKNPQEGAVQKTAKTAMKILKGTLAELPNAAKLVEAGSKLLPLISKLLGLG